MRWTLLILFAVTGCKALSGLSGTSDGDLLEHTVMSYNDSLRWKKFDHAAAFVPDKSRKEFLKLFEANDELLNIDDLEMKDVDWIVPGKKVKVTVDTKFYKLPSVTLRHVKWVQNWERHGNDFWLMNPPGEPFFESSASDQSASQSASQP